MTELPEFKSTHQVNAIMYFNEETGEVMFSDTETGSINFIIKNSKLCRKWLDALFPKSTVIKP